MDFLLKVMYLDESGDHSLDKIDPSYPMFVLGGVIVDRAYVRNTVMPRMKHIKEQFFDRDDIILHTADIIRAKNGFECLKDTGVRKEFYTALNAMMRDLEFTVIACAIRKDEHLSRYGANAIDPYMYSLEVLVERFCRVLEGKEDGGIIYAEKRGPELDRMLELSWMSLQTTGTTYAKAKRINECIVDLTLRDKQLNVAGLQLADLVVSPIRRAIMGKQPQEDWTIVESKFRRHPVTGSYNGYGLVVLPK